MTDQPTPSPEVLWCVHIPGPDDLYPAPTREAAQKHADALNVAIRQYFERHPRTENDPSEVSMTAVVIEWPWDAEGHAESLLKELRDD